MHSGLLSRYLSRRDVGIGLLLLDMAPSRCSACRNARTGTEEKNTIHFPLYSLSLSFFFLSPVPPSKLHLVHHTGMWTWD